MLNNYLKSILLCVFLSSAPSISGYNSYIEINSIRDRERIYIEVAREKLAALQGYQLAWGRIQDDLRFLSERLPAFNLKNINTSQPGSLTELRALIDNRVKLELSINEVQLAMDRIQQNLEDAEKYNQKVGNLSSGFDSRKKIIQGKLKNLDSKLHRFQVQVEKGVYNWIQYQVQQTVLSQNERRAQILDDLRFRAIIGSVKNILYAVDDDFQLNLGLFPEYSKELYDGMTILRSMIPFYFAGQISTLARAQDVRDLEAKGRAIQATMHQALQEKIKTTQIKQTTGIIKIAAQSNAFVRALIDFLIPTASAVILDLKNGPTVSDVPKNIVPPGDGPSDRNTNKNGSDDNQSKNSRETFSSYIEYNPEFARATPNNADSYGPQPLEKSQPESKQAPRSDSQAKPTRSREQAPKETYTAVIDKKVQDQVYIPGDDNLREQLQSNFKLEIKGPPASSYSHSETPSPQQVGPQANAAGSESIRDKTEHLLNMANRVAEQSKRSHNPDEEFSNDQTRREIRQFLEIEDFYISKTRELLNSLKDSFTDIQKTLNNQLDALSESVDSLSNQPVYNPQGSTPVKASDIHTTDEFMKTVFDIAVGFSPIANGYNLVDFVKSVSTGKDNLGRPSTTVGMILGAAAILPFVPQGISGGKVIIATAKILKQSPRLMKSRAAVMGVLKSVEQKVDHVAVKIAETFKPEAEKLFKILGAGETKVVKGDEINKLLGYSEESFHTAEDVLKVSINSNLKGIDLYKLGFEDDLKGLFASVNYPKSYGSKENFSDLMALPRTSELRNAILKWEPKIGDTLYIGEVKAVSGWGKGKGLQAVIIRSDNSRAWSFVEYWN